MSIHSSNLSFEAYFYLQADKQGLYEGTERQVWLTKVGKKKRCDVGVLIDFASNLAMSLHSSFSVKQLSIYFIYKKVIVAYFLLSVFLVRVWY